MQHPINSDINIIGGIPDYGIIYDVLRLLSENPDADTVLESFLANNKYGIRTEEARGRFLRVIKSSFWRFENDNHKILICSLFRSDRLENTKRYSLFWLLGINNALFEGITVNTFIKAYFSGRVQIEKNEIIAYLNHFRETDPVVQKWSESTIEKVASKYLTFLRKIDFVKGRQKKEFRYIQVDDTSIIFFIYLLKAIETDQPDILKNKFIDFLFLERNSIPNLLKKAKYIDYFDMQTTGKNLIIDLKYDFGELINVISN